MKDNRGNEAMPKGYRMAHKTKDIALPGKVGTAPRADILEHLAGMDLPPRLKADAIAAYLRACGVRLDAPRKNKHLPSADPQDMSQRMTKTGS